MGDLIWKSVELAFFASLEKITAAIYRTRRMVVTPQVEAGWAGALVLKGLHLLPSCSGTSFVSLSSYPPPPSWATTPFLHNPPKMQILLRITSSIKIANIILQIYIFTRSSIPLSFSSSYLYHQWIGFAQTHCWLNTALKSIGIRFATSLTGTTN